MPPAAHSSTPRFSADKATTPSAPSSSNARGGGNEGFVAKLSATGSALTYSSFLGGTGDDAVHAISVDATGALVAVGRTGSTDFPTTAGAFQRVYGGGLNDRFIAKVNPQGAALTLATYFGGSGDDDVNGSGSVGVGSISVKLSADGLIYVAGSTTSVDFPVKDAIQSTLSGPDDGTLSILSGAGALVFSTYVGGTSSDRLHGMALDNLGAAYLLGGTSSTSGTSPGAYDTTLGGTTDAFLTKISAFPPLALAPDAAALAPRTTLLFKASGGSGAGYGWTLSSNASGATIDATSGLYSAGGRGGVTDVVQVTDGNGATRQAKVSVSAADGGGSPITVDPKPPAPGAATGDSAPSADAADAADEGCGCRTGRVRRGGSALLAGLFLFGVCLSRRHRKATAVA
jgi:hypothetical protein